MAWTSFIVVKTVQLEEAKQVMGINPTHPWWLDFEDMSAVWMSGYSSKYRMKLHAACIPYAMREFQDGMLETGVSGQVYYNRDGESIKYNPLRDEDEMTLCYRKLIAQNPKMPLNMIYRLSQVLSGHADWGDVKHNTAMARMRQALLT